MPAKQGDRYRILGPANRTDRTVIGQGPRPDRYRATVNGVRVEDVFGDVITASENVDYPRGNDDSYRNVQWIDEHPERFKKLKKTT